MTVICHDRPSKQRLLTFKDSVLLHTVISGCTQKHNNSYSLARLSRLSLSRYYEAKWSPQ